MILTHGANSLARGGGDFVEIGGRRYPVVKIGNQLWMAENLDWKLDGITIGGNINTNKPSAWYYNDDETQYGQYGLLYNAYSLPLISNAIPEDWRVPTKNDLDALAQFSPSDLKSSSWGGTNSTRFNAFPSGRLGNAVWQDVVILNKEFNGLGEFFGTWSSTKAGTSHGYDLQYNMFIGDEVYTSDQYSRYGYSLRLVKDAT
jgi:uncharacterized protein (TIGR02145 family)